MWLQAYGSTASEVYFGNSELTVKNADVNSAEFMGRQTNNIFYPGTLISGETYYWRIDAIVDNKPVIGDVWSFTAGTDANPPVFKAEIKVYGKHKNIVTPLEDCSVILNARQASTDQDGIVSQLMLKEGKYYLSLEKADYTSLYDSVYISSDTLIIDTLDYIKSYVVQANISNISNGEAISQALISYQGTQKITDNGGNVDLDHLLYGKLTYTVMHNEYFDYSDSLMVPGDTSIRIFLTPLNANISISVSDQVGPVENAEVTFGSWLTSTYSNGFAYLVNLPARQQYNYFIEKEGYESIKDSLWLEIDTTITLSMDPVSSQARQSDLEDIRIYPNPALDHLTIVCKENALIKFISPDGRVLVEKMIYQGENTLNVLPFNEGMYIVQIESGTVLFRKKLLLINNQ